MMNVLSISLVLASLLGASVWSPSPPNKDHRDEVIVKDGHRVVVVEYDKEADGSTKVLISPHDEVNSKETTSSDEKGIFSGPRELVCDAYGKCKHKIANAIGKTRDKVEEAVHGVTDKARELEEHAKEAVGEAVGKGKQDYSKAKDKVSEKVTGTGHTVGESLGKAKDTVTHGVDKAKKVAGDVADTVKEGAKNLHVMDSAKTLGGDIERNVSAGKIGDVAKETVESVQEVVSEKSLGEILRKLKEVGNDVVWYVMSRDKVNTVAGLIYMLGFSTAYGMCVWVTFISSYILGRYLPKQQFGLVQSRIYPVYFRAMAYCISAALLGYLASRKNEGLRSMIGFPGLSLLSALLTVLINMIFLEPRATKTMYERLKIEKEEGRGVATPTQDGMIGPGPTRASVVEGATTVVRPTRAGVVDTATTVMRPPVNANAGVAERQDVLRLNEKLKRLNMYSSMLNVLTLVGLTWHMAYMGRRLHATTK